ncbi:hypothetical protein D3C76_1652170 [compost metagenome]
MKLLEELLLWAQKPKVYKSGNVSVLAGPLRAAKHVMNVLVVSKSFVRVKM